MLSAKQVASSTIFLSFGMTQPGIEPQSPRPLVNTLFIRPILSFNTYTFDRFAVWKQMINIK